MKHIKQILVVLEPGSEVQVALERGVELARRSLSPLHVLLCVWDPVVETEFSLSQALQDSVHRTAVKEAELLVNELLEPVRAQGVEVTSAVLWHKNTPRMAVHEVRRVQADILIKRADREGNWSRRFSSVDRRLSRTCPCPVWLVSDITHSPGQAVLAAVNVSAVDDEHSLLNDVVMEHAVLLGKLLQSPVKVVNVYPSVVHVSAMMVEVASPLELQQAIVTAHQERLVTLAERFHVSSANCLLREGEADRVLPQVAQEEQALVLVLGTVARTGLAGWFMGNTAERVLESLEVDSLALKPRNYYLPDEGSAAE